MEAVRVSATRSVGGRAAGESGIWTQVGAHPWVAAMGNETGGDGYEEAEMANEMKDGAHGVAARVSES